MTLRRSFVSSRAARTSLFLCLAPLVASLELSCGTPADEAPAAVSTAGAPLLEQAQRLTASDGAAQDWFGYSVAISGDTAVVGAYQDAVGGNALQGSAYVFTRSGSTWTQQAKLTASDGDANDYFGYAVAVSGDTAVIGAAMDEVFATNGRGSAYVFTRSGSTWTEQAKLTAYDGTADDTFGGSVVVEGDTTVIGALFGSYGTLSSQGSAYVFTRSGTTWTQAQQLVPADAANGDEFGYALSLSGDTLIVTSRLDDTGSNSSQGGAYVFARSGGVWSEQAKLTASDGGAGDFFGRSAAVAGDTAVIGASSADVGANTAQGAAYVFTRSGTTWTQKQKLVASDGAGGDLFGYGAGIAGNSILVSTRNAAVGANVDQGSAYRFELSGNTWTQTQKLTALDGAANDHFGRSVAVSGGAVIIGAYGKLIAGNDGQGAAYVFAGDNGDACSSANDCSSGHCVDGVCCDTACGVGDPDDCVACSTSAGASTNGSCGTRTDGSSCNDGVACNGADTCSSGACNQHASTCGTGGAAGGGTGGAAGSGTGGTSAGGTGAGGTSAGGTGAGGTGAGGTGAGGTSAGGTGAGGTGAGGTAGSSSSSGDDGGCGCKAAKSRSPGAALGALLAGLALLVRRRRS